MRQKSKLVEQVRAGMPVECIVCGKQLSRKSEHYCSKKCHQKYSESRRTNQDLPDFISKWKQRKIRKDKDPWIAVREKTRRKTSELVKRGKLKKKPCLVCRNLSVLAHHENYTNPWEIIWLCESCHKDYHNGKIGLYNDSLWWDPVRLVPGCKPNSLPKKYRILREIQDKKLNL